MNISPALAETAKKIKLIAMDVDGVLTAGEIIVLRSGEEVKFWNVRDRFAFHLLRHCGLDIRTAWITGRESDQVAERAKEIGIDVLVQGCMRKRAAAEEVMRGFGIRPDEVLFIGDDLIDIPVFRIAGLAACPCDAPEEVKKEAHYITSVAGGKGVLREMAEIVLKARGAWEHATKDYL